MSAARAQRMLAVAATFAALSGCIELTKENLVAAPAPHSGAATVTPWRTINGGFLGGPSPLTGVPVRPGVGAYVRLVAPTAVAVRGNDVLIVDSGAARVYRYDIALNALITIGNAPATPETRVALGPDLSAYVLDTAARRLLRFGRDGRLLQTFRTDAAATPADFALAEDGVSIQMIDRTQMQVALLTSVGASVLPLRPERADDPRVGALAAIAIGRAGTYLLDAGAGLVHLIDREGRVLRSFGHGQLELPGSLAVDRFERVYVTEPAARAIKVFRDGALVQTLTAADLHLPGIGAIAIGDPLLAATDRDSGQVSLLTLRAEATR